MLSDSEKEFLYEIIAAMIGNDESIKAQTKYFNEETISVVESMVAASDECNANMKKFITELVGATIPFSRGWLKIAIKATKKKISKSNFNGYGCQGHRTRTS